MAGGYVVLVGHQSPKEVFAAHPNKKGEPTGDKIPMFLSVGMHQIMNMCSVWGQRLMPDKSATDKDGKPIEHNTPGYGGDIKFLKWGDPKGCQIQLRYLTKSRSLDADYQTNIQKVKVDANEGVFLNLNAGQNKFDYKKQELLISFLKVHPQNRDSVSKNPDPDIKGYTFYEETDEMVDGGAVSVMEAAADASYLVKGLSNKAQSVRNLFGIMGRVAQFGETNNLSSDKEIYKVLLRYSQSEPEDFFARINQYKKDISDAFEMAKSFNALDLTKDGHIGLLVNNKKTLVFTDIEAKGDKMVDYVMENYADEAVYKQSKELMDLVKKLK